MPKIDELPSANSAGRDDIAPVVQSGITREATIGMLLDGGLLSEQAGNQLTQAVKNWFGTQADYDALAPDYDENTTYTILPG